MRRFVRRLWRWPIVVGVVVVILLGGGAAAWALTRSSGSPSATSQLVAARMTTIVQTVSASGTIDAAKTADLDFAVSGRVTHVRAKVGDVVSKGQTLATVGTAALAEQAAAAAATVTADEDKVAADSAGSAQQAADEAALTAARSALHNANVAVDDARLKATINGTVTAVDLSVGQQVNGGSSGSNGGSGAGNGGSSAQVSLQSTSTFVVDATVDDTEISEVKKGQAVAITPEGATTTVAGTVTSVSTVPTSTSGVVSFPIVVALTGHPANVYAGSSATMAITTSKAVNVLAIPTLAITYSGSAASVEVKSGGTTTKRTITVGQTYGLQTAVKSGLVAGDEVVVQIPTFARTGTGTGTGGGGGTFTRGGGFGGGGFGGGGFGGGTGNTFGGSGLTQTFGGGG